MKRIFFNLGAAALISACTSLHAAANGAQARITLVEHAAASADKAAANAVPGASADPAVVRSVKPGLPVREAHNFVRKIAVGTEQTEVIEVAFHGATTIKGIEATNDFHVVSGGSCREGQAYAAGQSCSVDVTFKAMGPGKRAGKLNFITGESPAPETIGLQGTTYGPALAFTPAQITTLPQTLVGGQPLLYQPGDVVVDQGDNLYFSDVAVGAANASGRVYFLDGSNALTTLAGGGTIQTTGGALFTPPTQAFLKQPTGLAVDPFLNVHIAETGANAIDVLWGGSIYGEAGYGNVPGTTCTIASPCDAVGSQFLVPYWINADNSGNIFFNDIYSYYSLSNGSQIVDLSNTGGASIREYVPFGLDSQDNFFLLRSGQNYCQVDGWSMSSDVTWAAAGSGACGFAANNVRSQNAEVNSNIGGYAFDAAGDMYFADTTNNVLRRVDNNNGLIHTVGGNNALGAGYSGDNGPATDATLNFPWGVAVDSNGVIYTASELAGVAGVNPLVSKKINAAKDTVRPDKAIGGPSPVAVIRQIGPKGQRNFSTELLGKTSPAQTILLTNVGNDYLTVSKQILGGTDAGDFVAYPAATSCNWVNSLAPGQSCQLAYVFAPKAAGLRTATVLFEDNTATFANTLLLSGVGIAAPVTPTVSITTPASGANYYYETNVPVSVTVTNNIQIPTVPTGTVTLTATNTATNIALAPVTVALNSKGIGTATFAQPPTGGYSLVAKYNGDTNDAAASSPAVGFAVFPVTASAAITSPVQFGQYNYGATVPVTASVTSNLPTPYIPTGTVTFTVTNLDTNAVLSPVTKAVDASGVASASLTGLKSAEYQFVAKYNGDSRNGSVTSAARIFIVNQVHPTITWPTPAAIAPGTALSATQLNAKATFNGATVTGSYVYTPASGTVMNSLGSNNLSVAFTPTDTTDFLTTDASNTVQVVIGAMFKKTVVTLASLKNPVKQGSAVALKTVVGGAAGKAEQPDTTLGGTVTLSEAGHKLATAPLKAGAATLSVKGLKPGTHVLTAEYSGDAQHAPSASHPLHQIVVTVSGNPAHISERDRGAE